MSYLIVTRKDMRGRHRAEVVGPSFTIGRAPSNMLVLPDDRVSRQHCVIETLHEVTRLRDLGAHNGIKVNTERRAECTLAHGDAIRIGPYELMFFASSADAVDDMLEAPLNGHGLLPESSGRSDETMMDVPVVAAEESAPPEAPETPEAPEHTDAPVPPQVPEAAGIANAREVVAIRAEIERIQAEQSDRVRGLDRRIRELQAELVKARRRAEVAETDLDGARQAVSESQEQARAEAAHQLKDSAASARAQAVAEIDSLKERLQQGERSRAEQVEREQAREEDLQQLRSELAEATARAETIEAELNSAREALRESQRQGEAEAAHRLEESAAARAQAAEEIEALTERLQRGERAQSDQTGREQEVERTNQRLQSELAEATARAETAESERTTAREALRESERQGEAEVAHRLEESAARAQADDEIDSIRAQFREGERARDEQTVREQAHERHVQQLQSELGEGAARAETAGSELNSVRRELSEAREAMQAESDRLGEATAERAEAMGRIASLEEALAQSETARTQAEERTAGGRSEVEALLAHAERVVLRGEDGLAELPLMDEASRALLSQIADLHRQRRSLEAEAQEREALVARDALVAREAKTQATGGEVATSALARAQEGPEASGASDVLPSIVDCFAGDDGKPTRYREDRDWMPWAITAALLVIVGGLLIYVLW